MRRSPAQRTLDAECRAVESGRLARLDGDGRRFLVRSDTWPDVDYAVRLVAVGEVVTFECDHGCVDQATGRRVAGRHATVTYIPCKHAARCARRLEREGLLRWEQGRWLPTAKAYELGVPKPAADPFAGLPK